MIAPQRQLRGVARYVLAVVAAAVALGLSLLVEAHISRVDFVLFWPAVLFVAVLAGLGPALLTSALSVLAVDWFFILPVHTLHLADPSDVFAMAIFVVASSLVSTVADRHRTAEKRATEAAHENAELAVQLEHQAIELESQLEESQTLSEELEQTSAELHERINRKPLCSGAPSASERLKRTW